MQSEVANISVGVRVKMHSIWAADPVSLPPIRVQTRHWLAASTLEKGTEQDLVFAVNEGRCKKCLSVSSTCIRPPE